MNKKIVLYTLVLFLAGLSPCHSIKNNTIDDQTITVILSLDGFRWDYPERYTTPVLDSIARSGVKAERMIPCFPTVTFANHYSLATGLFPSHHGIVLNSFFATDLNRMYNKGDRSTVEDGAFYGGEPIWITAEKQGVTAATFFWVGSEAEIQGIRPTFWKKYDHKFPYESRIDTVIHWLSLPEDQRPRLIMWYFDEPDGSGHRFGPESAEMQAVISRLDSLVGVFTRKMNALPHARNINFIVTSDHGMSQLTPDKMILLDHFVDTSKLEIVDGWNPTMNLKIKDGYSDEVLEDLKKIEHLTLWKAGEAPVHLQQGKNDRFHDLTLVGNNGYSVYWSWNISDVRGTHGYDNSFIDMHTIFYATGPDFKKAYTRPPFQNIHVYSLLAALLGIEPAQTDGHLDIVKDMLIKH